MNEYTSVKPTKNVIFRPFFFYFLGPFDLLGLFFKTWALSLYDFIASGTSNFILKKSQKTD